ncbi:MAG: N-methyl-L-tryptophan oxidase [Chloroflexota bacterium]|nr:N-methyl-L-tryptophan oxidase [Chloroflexota bacterium]
MSSQRRAYDVIVVGVGGMGSAACYHLARRGLRTLGLERFDIPHSMGSSHGVTRIIRLAYYEHPSYVPLLLRAFALWDDLARESGRHLLEVTGTIDASGADEIVFTGALEACERFALDHEVITSAELTARYPGYRLPSGHMALFQPRGGFLLPERCINAHVAGALAAGAEIRARERVLAWEPAGDGVRVTTERGVYEAGRLILAAGAWMGSLVPELAALAQPERQVLGWFAPIEPALFTPRRFPVFNLMVPEGRYYGFPQYDVPGFKIGLYHHREELVDPDDFQREADVADEALLRAATARYFPSANGPTMALRTCMFTNTPDEHFILDHLPGFPQVIVASPCSGHGFKFASVIGEILADLAQRGETEQDIGFLRLSRFAEQPLPAG